MQKLSKKNRKTGRWFPKVLIMGKWWGLHKTEITFFFQSWDKSFHFTSSAQLFNYDKLWNHYWVLLLNIMQNKILNDPRILLYTSRLVVSVLFLQQILAWHILTSCASHLRFFLSSVQPPTSLAFFLPPLSRKTMFGPSFSLHTWTEPAETWV